MNSKKVFKKIIKEDQDSNPLQLLATICKENKITFAAASGKDHIVFDFSYNQLISVSKFLHNIIDAHYQQYESRMEQEKTQIIYLDDPIDW